MKIAGLMLVFITVVFVLTGCILGEKIDKRIEFSLTKDHLLETFDPGETQSFTVEDDLAYFSSHLTGKTGKYVVMFEKDRSMVPELTEEFEVSPDWTGVVRPFYLPDEPGSYTMKIFTKNDEKLVSKGSFEIADSKQ